MWKRRNIVVVVEACLDLRLQPCAEAVAAAVAAALLIPLLRRRSSSRMELI